MHIRRLPTRWEVVGLDLSERCQRRSTFFHLLRHVRTYSVYTEKCRHTYRKSIRLRSRRRQVQKLFSQMRCVCTRCRSSSIDGNDSGGDMNGRKKRNGISEQGFSIHSRTRTNESNTRLCQTDCYCVRCANEWIPLAPLSTTMVRFHPSWLLSRVSSFSLPPAHSHSKLKTDELLPP